MNVAKQWPTEIKENEILFAGVDAESANITYLVFSSQEKKKMYVRADGTWLPIMIDDSDILNDLEVYQVTLEFIPVYDKAEAAGTTLTSADADAYATKRPMTAAAGEQLKISR
jgi:hypothetical protein